LPFYQQRTDHRSRAPNWPRRRRIRQIGLPVKAATRRGPPAGSMNAHRPRDRGISRREAMRMTRRSYDLEIGRVHTAAAHLLDIRSREESPMPTLHIPPSFDLHYLVDDYTDPWRTPGTVLLLHGNAESSASWYAWVPRLAHRYRVVRPDMRGFGASTPMPRDFPWSLDVLIDDFCRLMEALGVERFHLVGAKIGGTIARAFAARRPERVHTLTVVGTPPPYRIGAAERAPALIEELEQPGHAPWAAPRMAG